MGRTLLDPWFRLPSLCALSILSSTLQIPSSFSQNCTILEMQSSFVVSLGSFSPKNNKLSLMFLSFKSDICSTRSLFILFNRSISLIIFGGFTTDAVCWSSLTVSMVLTRFSRSAKLVCRYLTLCSKLSILSSFSSMMMRRFVMSDNHRSACHCVPVKAFCCWPLG